MNNAPDCGSPIRTTPSLAFPGLHGSHPSGTHYWGVPPLNVTYRAQSLSTYRHPDGPHTTSPNNFINHMLLTLAPTKPISMKCLADESAVVELGEVELNDKLDYIEEPVQVLDRKTKRLRVESENYMLIGLVGANINSMWLMKLFGDDVYGPSGCRYVDKD
ncbi:hypothetical protein OSB04_021703 [Centaurea solstitialis]|uniref:Uncharacterized protein n=1 Tax=Centaurea solstitialis TaxID=347529 RepID=A0AA38T6Q7_9ASTR|nr:hypothetical protein OSB04_021703 [Centaurea solstitialis]